MFLNSAKKEYFKKVSFFYRFPRDFKILCIYELMRNIAIGMTGIFLPIFFFQKFSKSIFWVIIFYWLSYLLFLFFVPLGAKIMSRIGLKKSMIIGRVIVLFFYLSLVFFQDNLTLLFIFSQIILLIFRIFYWVPYHTDFAKFTDGKMRGREIAFLRAGVYIAGIISPFLAGLILSFYNFNVLFVVAIFIFASSIVPLSWLSETREKFSFSYFQTFRILFKRYNWRMLVAYASDGAQSFVGMVIWPVFIFQLLRGNYEVVGGISALIVLATVLLQLVVGGLTDKTKKKNVLKWGSALYSLGWVFRGFVNTAFNIFLASVFQNFSALLLRTPFDALFYEKAADRGSYVDEYTVLREISLNIGKAITGLILLLLIYFFGIRISFILAGIASLFVNLL